MLLHTRTTSLQRFLTLVLIGLFAVACSDAAPDPQQPASAERSEQLLMPPRATDPTTDTDKIVGLTVDRPPPDPEFDYWTSDDTLRLVYEVEVITNREALVVGFRDSLETLGWRVIRGDDDVTVRKGVDWTMEYRGARPVAKDQDVHLTFEYVITPEKYKAPEFGIVSLGIPYGKGFQFIVPEARRNYVQKRQEQMARSDTSIQVFEVVPYELPGADPLMIEEVIGTPDYGPGAAPRPAPTERKDHREESGSIPIGSAPTPRGGAPLSNLNITVTGQFYYVDRSGLTQQLTDYRLVVYGATDLNNPDTRVLLRNELRVNTTGYFSVSIPRYAYTLVFARIENEATVAFRPPDDFDGDPFGDSLYYWSQGVSFSSPPDGGFFEIPTDFTIFGDDPGEAGMTLLP